MRGICFRLICIGLALCASPGEGVAQAPEQGLVTTTPVLLDGVLYVAGSGSPAGRGHLRAIDVLDTIAVTLWDAADKVPLAGDAAAQPENIVLGNSTRSLFTNIGQELLPLDAASAPVLQGHMDVDSLVVAEVFVHALRGRRGGSVTHPAGIGEDPQRLWSLRRSSPLIVGGSTLASEMVLRDRVLYIGADDGLLHAFFVSAINPDSGQYLVDDPDGGTELWGYLPASFLPYLKDQPFTEAYAELAISLDGTPQAREVFVDFDGDGQRGWRTLLAATGTIYGERQSSLFVLDVTDPYAPQLLWEQLLPGDETGRTRGVELGSCDASRAGCLYLSTDSRDTDDNGLHVLAVTLDKGELLWQFSASYEDLGPVADATPALPVLADFDGDKEMESLILGDMFGRLWVLDVETGEARGGGPVFTTPGGLAEPIGVEVAVLGNTVVFDSGGVEAADPGGEYMLYAVEILSDGAHLRWAYPLLPGERAWEAPRLDPFGNLMLATSRGFGSASSVEGNSTSGRVVALNRDGEEIAVRETDAATVGRVVTAPGVALSVDLTGEVTQFGAPARLSGPSVGEGSVKILSWRQL